MTYLIGVQLDDTVELDNSAIQSLRQSVGEEGYISVVICDRSKPVFVSDWTEHVDEVIILDNVRGAWMGTFEDDCIDAGVDFIVIDESPDDRSNPEFEL